MPKSLHDIDCPETEVEGTPRRSLRDAIAEDYNAGFNDPIREWARGERIANDYMRYRPLATEYRPPTTTDLERWPTPARERAVLANDNVGIMLEFATGRAMNDCLAAYRANPTQDEYGNAISLMVDGVEKQLTVRLRIRDRDREFERMFGMDQLP